MNRNQLHTALLMANLIVAGMSARLSGEENKLTRTDRHGDPLPAGAIARLGTIRLRREDGACCDFAFMPDGKALVSARNGKVLQFWDATTGKPLREFRHDKKFHHFVLAANGKILVSAGSEEITVWDASNGKQLRKVQTEGVACLAAAPDGKKLAFVGKDRTIIWLWDLSSGEEKRKLVGHAGNVLSMLFTPDGKKLISADGPTVRFWDTATGRQVRKLDSDRAHDLALSPDGAVLATGGSETVNNAVEPRLILWDVTTGRKRRQLQGHEHFVESVTFAPDGKTLASSEVETIHLWDAATGKEVRKIEKAGWEMSHLAFSPDGKTLASTAPANETVVRLWDVATGKPRHPAGPDGVVRAVAFSPDGRFVATGSWLGHDHFLHVWDAATGKPLWECQREVGYIDRLLFTPDGKGVISSSIDGNLRLWDARTGEVVRRYPIPESRHSVVEIALSADGKKLTSISEAGEKGRTVIVWDVQTGKRLRKREGEHPHLLNIFSFSPDAETVAEPSEKTLRLCDVATGRQLLSLKPSNLQAGAWLEESVAFSADGRSVVAIVFAPARRAAAPRPAECVLHVWELESAKPRLRIAAGKDHLQAVAFAPDGRTLATAGKGVLQLWDVATGKELLAYRGQEAGVFMGALAFSPDGTRLVAGYLDSTALVWDVTPGTRRAGVSEKELGRDDLDHLWSDLAAEDAAKAHAAVWRLVAVPARAARLLKERLKPVEAIDRRRIRRLVTELDSSDFAMREAASKTLDQIRDQAGPLLRETLEKKPSLEVRRRIEELIARPRIERDAERLRRLRAIEALEHIGTSEARQLLQEVARGAPAARETLAAESALKRLVD